LLVGQALAVPTVEHLEQVEAAARATSGFTREIQTEIAEARLYRAGDPASAAAALLPLDGDDARDLLPLALSLAGNWDELTRILSERDDAPAADLFEAAHVAGDRLGDARRAAALLARARAVVDDPYALEHLIELASAGPTGPELPQLLREKLDRLPPDSLEAPVTRYLLVEALSPTPPPRSRRSSPSPSTRPGARASPCTCAAASRSGSVRGRRPPWRSAISRSAASIRSWRAPGCAGPPSSSTRGPATASAPPPSTPTSTPPIAPTPWPSAPSSGCA
jgi:hypothetical protein